MAKKPAPFAKKDAKAKGKGAKASDKKMPPWMKMGKK